MSKLTREDAHSILQEMVTRYDEDRTIRSLDSMRTGKRRKKGEAVFAYETDRRLEAFAEPHQLAFELRKKLAIAIGNHYIDTITEPDPPIAMLNDTRWIDENLEEIFRLWQED